jgi:hypothetical protein
MNLERTILEKLALVAPRLLKEAVLLQDVRLDESKVSLGDLRGALRRLESKEQITIVNDEDFTRIKITSAGQARILE